MGRKVTSYSLQKGCLGSTGVKNRAMSKRLHISLNAGCRLYLDRLYVKVEVLDIRSVNR